MKTPDYKVKEIVELKNKGLSSREIAAILGIGKSTVNDVYNREFQHQINSWESTGNKPKLLIFDLEIFP